MSLQTYRHQGHEIILVDGSSSDNTIALANNLCDQIITTTKGRARQMNAGAAVARGDSLLFLHADTQLPTNAAELIQRALTIHDWGYFMIRIDGRPALFRLIETLMNWRSRVSRIATGDQALFIRRQAFIAIRGFPMIAIMEDIAICKRLKSASYRPSFIRNPAITSSRRWQQYGILRTILLMWRMRLAYFLGSNPSHLARRYR